MPNSAWLPPPLSTWLARLPGQCAICHGWDTQRVCLPCISRFNPPVARCQQCALRVPEGVLRCGRCLKNPPPFDASLAAVDYAFPWDRLIARFKFKGALDLTACLADRLAEAHRQTGAPAPDLILPVPLSTERLVERGYNQSWELARHLAGRLGSRAEGRWLVRLRDTAHQLDLPPEEREANVSGAFAVEPGRRREIAGRDITLVDDVMTTAATAGELTNVLRQAGAARVVVWVVARTAEPGHAAGP